MTYSVISRQHHKDSSLVWRSRLVPADRVTVLEAPPSNWHSRTTQSLRLSAKKQVGQRLPAVAPAENAGRRAGAGAGATLVLVAIIRHQTSPVRLLSLVGSLPHLPLFLQCETESDWH